VLSILFFFSIVVYRYNVFGSVFDNSFFDRRLRLWIAVTNKYFYTVLLHLLSFPPTVFVEKIHIGIKYTLVLSLPAVTTVGCEGAEIEKEVVL
jgi:uncharacterized membrane protein